MHYVDVVIIIEHKDRELESAVALKAELEKLNISSVILQNTWNERFLSSIYSPKVIVTPWCYDNNDVETLCVYKGQLNGRFDILNLHCEQITSEDASEFLIPSDTAKNVYHCAWGNYFEDQLKLNGIPAEKIRVTGSPRLDFFREEYKFLSFTKDELAAQYNLDSKKRWILIVGNYSAAFMDEYRLSSLEERGIKNARENSKLSLNTYNVVLDWLDTAMSSHKPSNAEIIYRPHPSEPITKRLNYLVDEHPCFHVIKDLAIRDWLQSSDAAFMWNSTSSIEAAYSNTPVFAMRPIVIPSNLRFSLLDSIEQIQDYNSFERMLIKSFNGDLDDVNELFKEEIDYYYKRQNETAISLTASYISEIVNNGKREFSSHRKPLYGFHKAMNLFLKFIALKIGILQKIPKYAFVVNDRVTKKEIGEIEQKMKQNQV